MTAIMVIMGFEGGPSFLCVDPIVPTNCVEASRTTVCGWQQWGAKRTVLFGPRGITELPWQRQDPGIWVTENARKDLAASNTGEGSWLNLNPPSSSPSLSALRGAVNK